MGRAAGGGRREGHRGDGCTRRPGGRRRSGRQDAGHGDRQRAQARGDDPGGADRGDRVHPGEHRETRRGGHRRPRRAGTQPDHLRRARFHQHRHRLHPWRGPVRSAVGRGPGRGHLPGRRLHRPSAGRAAGRVRRRPHRGAARAAGHAVRQEHHRWRDQVHLARPADQDRGLRLADLRQPRPDRRQGRHRRADRRRGQRPARARGRGQHEPRRFRHRHLHGAGRQRQADQRRAPAAGCIRRRRFRRAVRAGLDRRHVRHARRADWRQASSRRWTTVTTSAARCATSTTPR